MMRGLVGEWELSFVAPSGNKWYYCLSCGAMKMIPPGPENRICDVKQCWKCGAIMQKGEN